MHSTFRSVEMHSRRRYKICICSVILGELESFQNYKGFSVLPKILDAIERFKVMLHGTIRNDDFSAWQRCNVNWNNVVTIWNNVVTML